MKKLFIVLLSIIPFIAYTQNLDMTFINEYCQVTAKTGGTLLLGEFFESCRVETQQTMIKVTKLNELTIEKYPDYPIIGTFVFKGQIYKYGAELVQVVQDHNLTAFDPHIVPALFSFYRAETGTLNWIENEKVNINDIRIYNSIQYKCLQAHMTRSTWRPDLVLGVLWGVVPTTQEWAIGVAYKVNNIVTYNGSTYKCLQAHTSILTWNPVSTINVLWKLQ
jgi:hypothetical protein